jgi:methylglutaconyl-CoA hydratase
MTPNAPASAAVPEGRVQLSVADGIGTVEFSHPKGNSLPAKLLNELAAGITTLGADAAARVIVLKSAGSSTFCAGASFDEFTAVSTPAEGQEFFSGFSRVILAMIRAPKFVLTRVQGRAAGGALGVIAASVYSFAVRTAQAKLSELQVGIGPFVVGVVLERKLGLAPFQFLGVHADCHDAEWCERHGLYAMLCDDIAALEPLDGAIDDHLATLKKILQDLLALGLANALKNDLLGRLRADSSERDRIEFLFNKVTHLDVVDLFLGLGQNDLEVVVLEFAVGNHLPATECLVITGFTIDADANIDLVDKLLFCCRSQCRLQCLKHDVSLNTLFSGQRIGQH